MAAQSGFNEHHPGLEVVQPGDPYYQQHAALPESPVLAEQSPLPPAYRYGDTTPLAEAEKGRRRMSVRSRRKLVIWAIITTFLAAGVVVAIVVGVRAILTHK